jgi:hypothetical protein
MNLKQLQKTIGQQVIASHKGIQIVGKLTGVRQIFGRAEGRIEFQKGSKPPFRWFWSNNISTI